LTYKKSLIPFYPNQIIASPRLGHFDIIYPLESPLPPLQFPGIAVAFVVKLIDVARPNVTLDRPFE
jgi:hypothetical protein